MARREDERERIEGKERKEAKERKEGKDRKTEKEAVHPTLKHFLSLQTGMVTSVT